jgi:hypothetical protein
MHSAQTAAPPAAAEEEHLHDPASREQFLETLRQRQLAAEARVSQLRDAVLEPPEAAAAANEEASEDDEDDGVANHGEPEDSSEEENGEDDEETEYENELEYYVGELICIDAISHESPSQCHALAPHGIAEMSRA